MADSKISALPVSTTPLAGTETYPIVQGGVTKQVSVANSTAGRAISATQLTLTTGNLIVASGQGIDFSATSGSGTSELFNDYEKGTYDYIQQTFINLELQRFINSLKTVETADSIVIPITLNPYTIYEIQDQSRQIIIPIFYNFTRFKCGEKRRETDTRDYLLELSEMIRGNYQILKTIFWFNYECNNEKENIDLHVYETRLQNRTNENEILVLYWIDYHVRKFNYINMNQQGSAPLFLTKNDSHITPCGLYSKYIPSGYYICKVFDYASQVDHSNDVIHVDYDYRFIGRLYDGLFPYSDLYNRGMLP
jgi:hypothetical protein